ncbi:MAG: hypothetical protein ABUM51_01140 [Bacteroidota bacterium]
MGKVDRIQEKNPTTFQAAAEPSSKGGLTLPAVPAFGQVIQPMMRQPGTSKPRKQSLQHEESQPPPKHQRREEEAEEMEELRDEEEEMEKSRLGKQEKKTEKEGEKEDKPQKKKKSKEKEELKKEKLISRQGEFGEYGTFIIERLEETQIKELVRFLDWARSENLKIMFEQGGAGNGATGETFLQIQTADGFIEIDNPAKPFTKWNLVKKDAVMRIFIKIYQPVDKAYVDPIHELVVHGMGYESLIKSIRKMQTDSPTEPALLYHFYEEYGDINANFQHEHHGSKKKKGENSKESGYAEFEPLVEEIAAKLEAYESEKTKSKRSGSKRGNELRDAAVRDVRMQSQKKGNVNAKPFYADHSMDLLIAWLGEKSMTKDKQQNCEMIIPSTVDADWANIILLYNDYLAKSNQSITDDSAIRKGLEKWKTQPDEGKKSSLKNWLAPVTTDFNTALLDHITATGDAKGEAYKMGDRDIGTSVSAAQIIGGTQDQLATPQLQALDKYRKALAKK